MARQRAGRVSKQIAAYAPIEKVEKWEKFCSQYEPILSRSKLLLAAAEDFMERASKYGLDIKTLRPLEPGQAAKPQTEGNEQPVIPSRSFS